MARKTIRVCRRESGSDGRPLLSVEKLHVPEGDALATEIAAFLQAVRARLVNSCCQMLNAPYLLFLLETSA